MNKITKIAAAAVLGLGLPFAALAPAMADDGWHRADRHEVISPYRAMAQKGCEYQARPHELWVAQNTDPDARATQCVYVQEAPDRWVGSFYIIWSN